MGKGRSHRNRNANRRSLQRSGGVTCLPPPRTEPARRQAQSPFLSGIPLGDGQEPLVTAGMSRQTRRKAERERRKALQPGAVPAPIAACMAEPVPDVQHPENKPLPANRSLSVPRAQWIETLRDWVGRLSYRLKRPPLSPRGHLEREKLERLRRDLAQTQRSLEGVIASLARQ